MMKVIRSGGDREGSGLPFFLSLSLCGSSPRCDARVPGSVPRGTTWFLRSLGIYLSPPKDMLFPSHALLYRVNRESLEPFPSLLFFFVFS
jgi:hypothetical protein